MFAFETERLRVRDLLVTDKENFFLLNGSEEVMRYIRPVKTREESDHQLEQILALGPSVPHNGRWAVEEKATGRFIGSFAIIPIPFDPLKTQLGYSFIPEYWGRGLASELAVAGLAYFLQNSSIPEIYGVTETPNIASQKVLLKAGFVYHSTRMVEGKELTIYVVRRTII
jgi:[ribosomal protein S5]-alanine N-acetyltransferase